MFNVTTLSSDVDQVTHEKEYYQHEYLLPI